MTSWILWAAAGVLGGMLLWGVISPRTHWRVLVGWSARDPDRSEPGDSVHAVTRIVCLLGLLGLLAVGITQAWAMVASQPRAAPQATMVEQMWGSPVPRLIDRVVSPAGAPNEEFAAGSIIGYQEIERGWAPDYLVSVPRWSLLGEQTPVGLIGAHPGDGFTGYGVSDLIVAAAGPLTCEPRAASAIGDEGQIQLDVYWGVPGSALQDHHGACAVEHGQLLQTVLIPIQLDGPVDGRGLVTFAGDPVPPVEIIRD